MGCSTPVIAYRPSSVPEVLEHGLTGFIVNGEREAVEAVQRIGEVDRRLVRARFEQRFTAKRMAENYIRIIPRFQIRCDHISIWRVGRFGFRRTSMGRAPISC
jgi:glycosyltransferase involved in cell wall biosynthesis